MSVPFEIPDWLPRAEPPPQPDVDPHRVEGLVNRFIAAKQDALFTAPDAYYRQTGADAVDGVPGIFTRLNALRDATLDAASDDGTRAALGPRLDLHIADASDGIDRHVQAQREAFNRQTLAERQALIRRAAALEHTNDHKLIGLAEANASAAQELARMNGQPEGPAVDDARSAVWHSAIAQRLANGDGAGALELFQRARHQLTDGHVLSFDTPLQVARQDQTADQWIADQTGTDGPPLKERLDADPDLPPETKYVIRAKVDARDSADVSNRAATVQDLDDQVRAAVRAQAINPGAYAPGTFGRLADAYKAAGDPEREAFARRMAAQDSFIVPFAQASAEKQQRMIDELPPGDLRDNAQAIQRHQAEAFARDPFTAGTALYPEVGPPRPIDDIKGRIHQARQIAQMRGVPVVPLTAGEIAGMQQSPEDIGVNPISTGDPNIVLASDRSGQPEAAGQTSQHVGASEISQAQPPQEKGTPPQPSTPPSEPKAQPSAKPAAPATQSTPAPTPLVATPTKTKPGDRPERTPEEVIPAMEARAKEWDSVVRATPTITERGQQLLPDDWEKAIDKINPNYSKWTKEAAQRYGIPPLLLARMFFKETGYNANAVNPTTGARGIAQLLPDALRSIKVNPDTFNYSDAKASIEAGAAYLAWNQNWYKDWAKSIAAYNWGIGQMERWVAGVPMIYSKKKGAWIEAPPLPDETKTTISHVFRGDPKAFDKW